MQPAAGFGWSARVCWRSLESARRRSLEAARRRSRASQNVTDRLSRGGAIAGGGARSEVRAAGGGASGDVASGAWPGRGRDASGSRLDSSVRDRQQDAGMDALVGAVVGLCSMGEGQRDVDRDRQCTVAGRGVEVGCCPRLRRGWNVVAANEADGYVVECRLRPHSNRWDGRPRSPARGAAEENTTPVVTTPPSARLDPAAMAATWISRPRPRLRTLGREMGGAWQGTAGRRRR